MHPNVKDGTQGISFVRLRSHKPAGRALQSSDCFPLSLHISPSIEGQLDSSTGEGRIQGLRGTLTNPGDGVTFVES